MLEVRELSVRRGQNLALDRVSFSLQPGEVLGVVGPNGAGKTTLLRSLAGVLAPSGGEVLLKGRSLAEISRREAARSLAYAPQESDERFGFTVREAVLLGRHPWRSPFGPVSGEDMERAEQAMEALDLTRLSDRPVTELSGGEKRRAALARTLAQGGEAFLLDEPSAGLDIRHALMTMRVFTCLAATKGAAVVVVLHDLNLAGMFCPRMLMLDAGRIAAYGPTPQVITPDNLLRVFGVQATVESLHIRFLEG